MFVFNYSSPKRIDIYLFLTYDTLIIVAIQLQLLSVNWLLLNMLKDPEFKKSNVTLHCCAQQGSTGFTQKSHYVVSNYLEELVTFLNIPYIKYVSFVWRDSQQARSHSVVRE